MQPETSKMARFKYRALDAQENPVEGVMDAASAREAVLLLQDQGLKAPSVERMDSGRRLFTKRGALTWSDLEQLNNQLALIVRGGLPLAPSLDSMARDLRNPRLRAVLEEVRMDLEAGKPLGEAFARHPDSFPPVYLALVRAGERAGNLAVVFMHLSDYSKSMIELKNRLKEILAYPIILLVTACVLVGFLMTKVVPVFADVFADFGGSLPAPTRLLIRMSDGLDHNHFDIIVGLALIVAAGLLGSVLLGRIDPSRYVRDRLKSFVPLYGRFFVQASLVRFSRALRMMIESNVPILESLELAAAASGNAVLERAVGAAARNVEGGAALADSLERTRYFDNGFCWLLRNAEQRGELQNALFLLENEYEQALTHLRNVILLVAGPSVVVAIGLVVGFIVLSLYLPTFTLGNILG